MRRWIVPALAGLMSLALTAQVEADASPPLYPPGSAVLPPGETMVQMVAETVEITIVVPSGASSQWPSPARAEYEARFTMRNQGQATEQMDVRFPLTTGDSWETIWDFAAFVDGEPVRVRKSTEAYALGDSRVTRWAVFPVTFEPGVDALITVTYSTSISGWGWNQYDDIGDSVQDAFFGSMNPDTATVYYILETGAGWYGPIETGTIVLTVPYRAGPINVLGLDASLAEDRSAWETGGGGNLSGPSFADHEARWEFSQLEPTRDDNLNIQFLWPDEWRYIQNLEAEAKTHPRDAAIALKLAGAYLAAGAGVYSGRATEHHCGLSQQEIQRALVFHPASEELLAGLDFIAGFCPDLGAAQDQATPTSTPVPATASSVPPTELPSLTPTATSTSTAAPTATATAALLPTDAPEPPTPTSAPPSSAGDTSLAVQLLVGLGAGIVVVVVLAGIRGRKSPPDR